VKEKLCSSNDFARQHRRRSWLNRSVKKRNACAKRSQKSAPKRRKKRRNALKRQSANDKK
jgi:hypothetical protein